MNNMLNFNIKDYSCYVIERKEGDYYRTYYRIAGQWWELIGNTLEGYFGDEEDEQSLEDEFRYRKQQFDRIFQYAEPADNPEGVNIVRITGKQIYDEYWDYWSTKMIKKFGINDKQITFKNCLDDWQIIHWAGEIVDDKLIYNWGNSVQAF